MKASDFLAAAELLSGDGVSIASGTLIGMLQKLETFSPTDRAPMRVQGPRVGSWDSDTAMSALAMYRTMQF